MPLLSTRGAASAQGFGEFAQASGPANYIEDVFSTWLYTGTGAAMTIANGVNLSGMGGLFWFKRRVGTTRPDHFLFDTNRGGNKYLASNLTNAEVTNSLVTFNSNGVDLVNNANTTASGIDYASWTFRKQPKFFDVVTWTGNGTNNRQIAHNLSSAPGTVIAKCTSAVGNWPTWHRSVSGGATNYNGYLNLTNVFGAEGDFSSNGTGSMNSTTFCVNNGGSSLNASGETYVAYLFAHDAGGFGLNGTDNVISCGSFTTDGVGAATVSLGYEPQFALLKSSSNVGDWNLGDSMRGFTVDRTVSILRPNSSAAETSNVFMGPTSTGFTVSGAGPSYTYIYIAIRRGPMKVPTTGTSVFAPIARTGTGTAVTVTGFQKPLDSVFVGNRSDATDKFLVANRLTGENYIITSSTAAESVSVAAAFPVGVFGVMNGFNLPATTSNVTNKAATNYINYGFTRAPGFFDEVCYTGTGSASQTINHNLSVVPELVINKSRGGSARNWTVNYGSTTSLRLNLTNAAATDTSINLTSTTFDAVLGSGAGWNASGVTYVTYLFATCPGVSKVGTYTGTGATQTINCGFTGGARFVLIKRTDSTGDWYVWDTARGIVAGNDPYLLLNSTAAEVTNTDYVDTAATGFEISSTAPAAINANGGTFIFLAIA